jgi:MATE family multidrug resistance protein
MALIYVPMCILMLNVEFLFDLVGFDKQASYYSQMYLNPILPGLFFNALADSNRRFLNTLGYQNGPMIIQLIATILHSGWCYILTIKLEMSAQGTGIATSITYFTTAVCLHFYTEKCLKPDEKEIAWFSPFRSDVKNECFDNKGLIDYFKLGIPSTGMLCLEWWAFEIMTVFAAYISLTATASQVIMMNMAALFFMPSLGLQTAGSFLIG